MMDKFPQDPTVLNRLPLGVWLDTMTPGVFRRFDTAIDRWIWWIDGRLAVVDPMTGKFTRYEGSQRP